MNSIINNAAPAERLTPIRFARGDPPLSLAAATPREDHPSTPGAVIEFQDEATPCIEVTTMTPPRRRIGTPLVLVCALLACSNQKSDGSTANAGTDDSGGDRNLDSSPTTESTATNTGVTTPSSGGTAGPSEGGSSTQASVGRSSTAASGADTRSTTSPGGKSAGGSSSANSVSTSPVGGASASAVASSTRAVANGGTTSTRSSNTSTHTNGIECAEATCNTHKWACWKMPTPVSESLPNPQNYTDLENGAVRDNVTCLVWEKANPATKTDWRGQFDRCSALASSNYAGFDDWRLPTRIEMASITDVTLGSTGYPKVLSVTGGYYTTGSDWYKTILVAKDSTAGNELDYAWGYGTNGFTSNAILRNPSDANKPELVARCVRGNGLGEAANEYAVEPPDHYSIADGEVTDNYTGLIWQQSYSKATMSHDEAVAYCQSLSLNGHTGWRLPALNELASTVNEARVGGAVVTSAFPGNPEGCKAPEYWFWAAEASPFRVTV